MTDRHHDVSQYKYSAMSNLVLQADRRFITRRTDEATGDPESLAGRFSVHDLGSRVTSQNVDKASRPSHTGEIGDRSGDNIHLQNPKTKRSEAHGGAGTGILATHELPVEGLIYFPRTQATRATFDLILTLVASTLGDVSQDVVRSAADAALEFLKDSEMKDLDKKREIDGLLGVELPPSKFQELLTLSKKITDYRVDDHDDEEGARVGDTGESNIDDRHGVAVVFDDNDDDEPSNLQDLVPDSEGESSDEDGSLDEPSDSENHMAFGATSGDVLLGNGSVLLEEQDQSNARLAPGLYQDAHKNQRDSRILVREIDAFWLQKVIGKLYNDPHEKHDKAASALEILARGVDNEHDDVHQLRDVENSLMELFDWEHNDAAAVLLANRHSIVWLTRLGRAKTAEEKANIENSMRARGFQKLLDSYQQGLDNVTDKPKSPTSGQLNQDLMLRDPKPAEKSHRFGNGMARSVIQLENLVFDQGNHLMTNSEVRLPTGSTKRAFKDYEEIHVPPPSKRNHSESTTIAVSQLPQWVQPVFKTAKSLNYVQSKCFTAAFEGDNNMLVCAPTGSGKTNVAMLGILRAISQHRDPTTGNIALDAFKIVYIAPLKALVQEQVHNLGKRLECFGVTVSELTGDRQLTKQQVFDTHVIVTTPEKWDVITRKASDLSYTKLVTLIIIDEIHLLHDERGPVLESIVSRTIRKAEHTGEITRIIGLSATLPNYRDVASFLRVDVKSGLFYFDASYRPCPLRQEFVGVTDRKPIKQLKTMNEVTYSKVVEHAGTHRNQVLIFVHSRKDTAQTAKYLRDKAKDMGTLDQIMRHDAANRTLLQDAAAQASDRDLKDLLPWGFGIHHAGMNRADRTDVEDLFARGNIQVLISTATLAWGVNLPAHTVIIKGTQVYSPERGCWVELSPQDVLQMLGRAGRPQYDTYGEGIIITTKGEMQYYLSLLTQQLPIESQLVSRLIDSLNAEIVLGNVRTRIEGAEWLGYTYLYIRMLRAPGLYGVNAEYQQDEALEQFRLDLIHSAALRLKRARLITYDEKSGRLQPTELGRIASHYYITYKSMEGYNTLIQPTTSMIDLFRIFSLSSEFKYIPVRQQEKLELAKILSTVPIPVKESVEEAHCKINVLLQAYISRLTLTDLALMADLIYVVQSAGRLLRALFEICLQKGWASVAMKALELCKMAERRMWPTMTPLRQFLECPPDVIRRAERMDVPWDSYLGLDPARMGELLGFPKVGRLVCGLISKFPRLDIEAQVQPLSRSLLRVGVIVTPNFEWDETLHGTSQDFWIVVQDCDGDSIVFHDLFTLHKDHTGPDGPNEHIIEFTVAIPDPLPPNFFITLVSDRWMHSQARIPISLQSLILPSKIPTYTDVLDLQPLHVSSLSVPNPEILYPQWKMFNKIQTQTFQSLFHSNRNVFIGAPAGVGKTVCAEFALLRFATTHQSGKALYLAPFNEMIESRFQSWRERLGLIIGKGSIVKLTGESDVDLKRIESSRLILATPSQWDALACLWKKRKHVRDIGLVIADDLHMLSNRGGHVYETAISRINYIRAQLESPIRIVALSVPIANAADIGDWIDAGKLDIFNFSPFVRPVPMTLNIQSINNRHFPSLMMSMTKPTYLSIVAIAPSQPCLVFVPSRSYARSVAEDMLVASNSENQTDRFLRTSLNDIRPLIQQLEDDVLAEVASHGIGYYHEALSDTDKRLIRHFYDQGFIQVLVVSKDACWELQAVSNLVIIMGTQYFDARDRRYLDYSPSEVLHMFGRATIPSPEDGKAKGILFLPSGKKEFYKQVLNEAIPVESRLINALADAFVTEIGTGLMESADDAIQWMTYTYLYRRLLSNPTYYNLIDLNHDTLSQYLSDVVEKTLMELADAKMITVNEDEGTVEPENAAYIAAHYRMSHITMQTFLLSLTGKTKLKGLVEIVASATEFEEMSTRQQDEMLLRRIYKELPYKMSHASPEFHHLKAYVLLQAHFSRMQLPTELIKDQANVLMTAIKLLRACVDILASEGHMNALNAMEISQMIVQAMWNWDSPLKQIPHFSPPVIKAANAFGITDVYSFMEAMNPEENEKYHELIEQLGLDQKRLLEVARFTNEHYPEISVDLEVLDGNNIVAGTEAHVIVRLDREVEISDEDLSQLYAHAPFYPNPKLEGWWLVVGDEASRSLYGIRKTSLAQKTTQIKVQFTIPTAGTHQLKLSLMSDSYLGVDQEVHFNVTVLEGQMEE